MTIQVRIVKLYCPTILRQQCDVIAYSVNFLKSYVGATSSTKPVKQPYGQEERVSDDEETYERKQLRSFMLTVLHALFRFW